VSDDHHIPILCELAEASDNTRARLDFLRLIRSAAPRQIRAKRQAVR
jgi:hypothetical protein